MKWIAHRGCSRAAPENTLAAFDLAWRIPVDGVELDVRTTSDGHAVVFHDADGARMAGDSRRIAELTLAELAAWRVGGEPVPTLEEVLAHAPSQSLTLIELKEGRDQVAIIAEILKNMNATCYRLLSFDPAVAMAAVKAGMPGWLNVEASYTRMLGKVAGWARDEGIEGISLGWSSELSAANVAAAHDHGRVMAVWTVNNAREADAMRAAGVDYLMTDIPDMLIRRQVPV